MEKIITVPFGSLLELLYQWTSNYGWALILFAVIVQLVLLPINMKSKKSMMKMTRLTPKIQAIKDKYPNDQQKQQEAIQKLQQEEGASMGCGGCLWSLVPMLILIPLYQVIREPIVYMLHESAANAQTIVDIAKETLPHLFTERNAYYGQLIAAANMTQLVDSIKEAIPDVGSRVLEGLDFNFLGINLGEVPQYNIFDTTAWKWDWAHIGCALIPLLSAGQQIVSMLISQRSNNSLVTDDKGVEDKQTAEASQSAQTTKMMLWMMPIMSLLIGFGVPAALSLYWLVGGVVRTIEDQILTKHYRKVYDEEDAERLRRHQAEEEAEAERERIRAEKRAQHPEGITENTSRKKRKRQQADAEAAERAANARDWAQRKGILDEDADADEDDTPSGIPDRPFAKGRAYDPNRYSNETLEEE